MFLLSLFLAMVSSFHDNFNKYVYKYHNLPVAQQKYQIMPFHIRHNRINIAEGNIHMNDMNVHRIKLDQSKDNECKYDVRFFDKVNNIRADIFIYLHCNIFYMKLDI